MRRRIRSESPFFANSEARDGDGWDSRPVRFKVSRKDDMREARRLWKTLSYLLTTPEKPRESDRRPAGGGAASRKQNCITKMRAGFQLGKHLRFLEEYLTQQKKGEVVEKPEMFSESDTDGEFVENYRKTMTGRHFKWIISPERPDIDCKALTRILVKRLEKITGYKFSWLAAVHTNTSHPHAHLLINGVDKNGKNVTCFRGVFLKQTVRELCREICTEMKGERTKEDMERAAARLPESNAYCPLDREIEAACVRNLKAPDEDYDCSVRAEGEAIFKRLCHLEKLGFARRRKGSRDVFELENGWADKLQSARRYSSYLKARNELLFTDKIDLRIFDNKNSVSGVVTKVYRMNYEESWDNALVIENRETGKAWFVPVYNEPSAKLLNAEVVCAPSEKGGKTRPEIRVTRWHRIGGQAAEKS